MHETPKFLFWFNEKRHFIGQRLTSLLLRHENARKVMTRDIELEKLHPRCFTASSAFYEQ